MPSREDGKTTWPGDPAPDRLSSRDIVSAQNEFSGNPRITYNGLDVDLFRPRLKPIAWTEIRSVL